VSDDVTDASVDDPARWPSVSVVMPIRDEAAHLERAVAAVLAQSYPRPFDVCLAVAPSSDGTEAVAAELAAENDAIRVVANPAGVTPAGLNAAIRTTRGDVVVRVDGHAELSDGYIRRAVETMQRTGAVNVGGVQLAIGETPFERAVAAAMTSWMGTGGSRFHVGGTEGPVDTVYLGVFDRRAIEAVGLFDESLVRNQDYELNIRLRAAGGLVWFDPALAVTYRPRGSFTALAKQYYEYGWWKAEVARMHPRSLKPRQLAPPLAMLVLVTTAFAGCRRPRWWLIPAAYLAGVAAASRRPGSDAAAGSPARGAVVVALATTHLSWAFGFWRSSMRQVAGTAGGRRRRYAPRT
jgi:succinoglycan biosynthesis protein ExoA